MGRKKKETYKEYAEAERAAEEQKEVETVTSEEETQNEVTGLNRHPHAMDEDETTEETSGGFTEEGTFLTDSEDETPATKEVKCPSTNCTFHLDFEEGAKCVNCGFTFDKENMATFENIDLHEESNEEFENGISETPKKLTAKERARRIFDLELRVANTKLRVDELEPIAELQKSTGFKKLLAEVIESVCNGSRKCEIKDAKTGIKDQEAVMLVAKLVADFSTQYHGSKRDIKSWEADIEELKAGQLSLLDGGLEDVDTLAPITAETQNILIDYGVAIVDILTEADGQAALAEVKATFADAAIQENIDIANGNLKVGELEHAS